MILKKTYIDKSSIQGLGLFAGEDLQKGEKIREFTKGIDLSIEKETVLNSPHRAYFEKYGRVSLYNDRYILPIDQCVYINHSLEPNCMSIFDEKTGESCVITKRDIKKGEEITEDYNLFETANHTFHE